MSLRYGILGLLTYSPMSGYHLKKVFDGSVKHMWSASLSQIYRDLGTLEKNGLISSTIEHQEDRPDKKVYTITEEGKIAFHEWLHDFPEDLSPVKRDAFMLRIFFGSQVERSTLLFQLKRFVIQKEKALKLFEGMGQGVSEQKEEIGSEQDQLFWRFTIRMAVLLLQSVIVWAKECIQELEKRQQEESS